MKRGVKARVLPVKLDPPPTPPPTQAITCDIFCRVVDNFGDIGVAFRLARQLANEFGVSVRLIVDDLASFKKLAPAIDIDAQLQRIGDITVMHWHENIALEPAQCVIEAFQCELPASYIHAMAAKPQTPATPVGTIWINLEYLSAESWVGAHHLLPSPHPQTGLSKFFFFPGFRADTGGLLRERALLSARAQFQRGQTAMLPKFSARRMPIQILLFGYENAALPALLKNCSTFDPPVECTIPAGALAKQAKALSSGVPLHELAFLPQPDFDRLLWSHDVLFVRGEDSFVRAQWAAKPFIWQIYPQTDNAHWVKLNAFLDLYCDGLDAEVAAALRELHRAWNDQDKTNIGTAFHAFMAQRQPLQAHAIMWAEKLAQMPDLATQLMTFYAKTARI